MTYPTSYSADILSDSRCYNGVRRRRILAFMIDILFLTLLILPAALGIFIFGLLTLGLGWWLYAILCPAVTLIYCALTLGGSGSATLGMRLMGLEARMLDGSKFTPVIAVLHALLFYASVSILTPLVLTISLVTDRKRLLHDLLLGTVIINRSR